MVADNIGRNLKIILLAYVLYKIIMFLFNMEGIDFRDFKLFNLMLDLGIWVVAWVISTMIFKLVSKM